MTYEELVQSVKDIYANADAGNVKEHVAIQCNIEGEAEGALYIEFSEGNIDVQPERKICWRHITQTKFPYGEILIRSLR